jgi:hypothetical protein
MLYIFHMTQRLSLRRNLAIAGGRIAASQLGLAQAEMFWQG